MARGGLTCREADSGAPRGAQAATSGSCHAGSGLSTGLFREYPHDQPGAAAFGRCKPSSKTVARLRRFVYYSHRQSRHPGGGGGGRGVAGDKLLPYGEGARSTNTEIATRALAPVGAKAARNDRFSARLRGSAGRGSGGRRGRRTPPLVHGCGGLRRPAFPRGSGSVGWDGPERLRQRREGGCRSLPRRRRRSGSSRRWRRPAAWWRRLR